MTIENKCLICGNRKTIDAHLIPRAFALEVTALGGEKHAIVHQRKSRFHTTNTGVYDPGILCGSCDGHLGKFEGAAYQLLKKLRELNAPEKKLIDVSPLDGDAMVKFAAGIAWKYSATKAEYGRISLGPYMAILADIAFEKTAIPSSVDVTAIQLQHGNAQPYFYRAPMPDRVLGINAVRFTVGGFIFFLKTDKRSNPYFPPAECWLRGKNRGSFYVAPAEDFEEWTIHAEIAGRSNVSSYFRRLMERKL